MRFTTKNAKAFGRKGGLAKLGKRYLVIEQSEGNGNAASEPVDPFVKELERAMRETLRELREAGQAKDRASCAQALRNLRETYHLVTGQPKPGCSRPATPRRALGQPSAAFRLPAAPAPQHVVSPSYPPTPVNDNPT